MKADHNSTPTTINARGGPHPRHVVLAPIEHVADPEARRVATVAELIDAYLADYRRRKLKRQGSVPATCRRMAELVGHFRPDDLNAATLTTVQEVLADAEFSRKYINELLRRFRTIARWGAKRGLVPASLLAEAMLVAALKAGQTHARELPPRRPVKFSMVSRTLRHVPLDIRGAVLFQSVTGARVGEVRLLRPCDIDRSNPRCWIFRPTHHKTAHHGHERLIPIGPRGQRIVRYFEQFLEGPDDFVFSPARAEIFARKVKREKRKTHWRQGNGAPKRGRPRENLLGKPYSECTIQCSIRRACRRAFPAPGILGPQPTGGGWPESPERQRRRVEALGRLDELIAWELRHRWSTHQLRHAAAVRLRKAGGLDLVQATLGHRSRAMSEHYAGLDMSATTAQIARLG